jgi:hypothetical protein
MDAPELLRYRSNLLGSDLRITNVGGGNTGSKIEMPDPLTGQPVSVLWVKGSGGDLGTINLYLDKLHALEALYRSDREDEMVGFYPLFTFGINGISPATVVKGSTMFPRDRVAASLRKYNIPFEPEATDEEMRNLLAAFYAQRTLTHQSIDPRICAESILFLAGPKSSCTTGHLIPVDGGLPDAFLR